MSEYWRPTDPVALRRAWNLEDGHSEEEAVIDLQGECARPGAEQPG